MDCALAVTTTFVVEVMLLWVVRATGVSCDGKLVRTTVDKILKVMVVSLEWGLHFVHNTVHMIVFFAR